jgi:hypothetical protein
MDLHPIAIELACCHRLGAQDFFDHAKRKEDQIENPYANFNEFVPLDKVRNATGLHTHHLDMMKKAMTICKREGVPIADYRQAMIDVRRMDPNEIAWRALDSKFFREVTPEEIAEAFIAHVMAI